jgi:hypothetical protein
VKRIVRVLLVSSLLVLVVPAPAEASHAWGPYHWARTSNPFTVVVVDGVSSRWDASLSQASTDWSQSRVLDTVVRAGSLNVKSCKPPAGKVAVCSSAYGNRGWLGLATISISGTHITKGSVQVNDTYFAPGSRYDTSAWRALVMCQEVGHTFGLDHQDEDFDNPNLGTCMDYTDDPGTNQHPNQHDYQQLEAIYDHRDSTTTLTSAAEGSDGPGNGRGKPHWGRPVRFDDEGTPIVFVRHLGGGATVVRFVIWAR